MSQQITIAPITVSLSVVVEREVFGRAPGRFARNLTLVRSPHGESPLMMLAAVTTRRLIAYQSHFLPHVVMLGVLTVF